jgi:outer membrane protein TolC
MSMKILVSSLLMLLCLSLAVPAFPQTATSDSLTVDEAVRLVLERNHSLREAEDAMAIFKAKVEQNESAFRPGVRGNLAYARIGPLSEISIPEFGSFQLYPANNYDLHAGLRQLLYDGKHTAETVNLSRSQVESAADRWELLKRDLAYQTVQLFDSILFLRENIRVQADYVKTLDDHLEVTRKKVGLGTATELDALNIQVRVVSAQDQKLDLENSLEKQAIALRKLIGFEEETPLKFRGEFHYESLAANPDELVQNAWQKRLEVRAVENLKQTANIQYRLAGTLAKPSLSLNVLVGAKNGYFPDLNKPKLNFVAAVQADIPIFDGHLTKSMKAEASANLKVVEDRNKELLEMIKAEVLQAIADVKTSEQKLQSVEINIEQARKALEFALIRYEAGTITNLDLLDTEQAHTEAEFIKLQALYKFVLAKLALERAVGNDLSKG